jgi:hypothetical protein
MKQLESYIMMDYEQGLGYALSFAKETPFDDDEGVINSILESVSKHRLPESSYSPWEKLDSLLDEEKILRTSKTPWESACKLYSYRYNVRIPDSIIYGDKKAKRALNNFLKENEIAAELL